MAGPVVLFDFDKTIIDCDCNNWVVHELGATEIFQRLLPTMPWNSLMDRMMEELHAAGNSLTDIVAVLKRVDLHPLVAAAIKSTHSLGCELKIVRDTNTFFIETILEHHDLLQFFSKIVTNPSSVDERGKLRISPHHDFRKSPHGCPNCPPNLCKGLIVDRILERRGKKCVIYLGDGQGDYCPSLRLSEEDSVMPRKKYPLWELISQDPSLLKAEFREWSNAEEQVRILLELVNGDLAQILSADCNIETLAMSAGDRLLHALPVFFVSKHGQQMKEDLDFSL